MATGQSLIDRVARLLRIVQSGSSATAAESADGLIAINAMLDSWRNDRLMGYALATVSKAMTAADASYTIGTGQDFNTARPVAIKHAYMTIGNTDYPVKVCTDDEWFAIADKTTTSDLVEKVWYNPTMSSGTVNVWPVPNATHTLYLVVMTPVADLTLAGTVALPPGWEEAIVFNGAKRWGGEFGAALSADDQEIARTSLAAIKRRNSTPITSATGLPGTARRHSIYEG